MVKSVSDNQDEIIGWIHDLYLPDGIHLDPTYSKGVFYKNMPDRQPKYKSDLYPQCDGVDKANANNLLFPSDSITSIMFDPPFLAGYTKEKATGKIGERFTGFRYIPDLLKWYDSCINEFYRILKMDGVLIFKCQDTVSSHKQWFSHVHIINYAESVGFYTKDLFILTAKSRMIGHNHKTQKHARKFHSYFLVFVKK